MKELVARPDTVAAWIRQLAQRQAVFFPQRAGERSFRFAPVSATSVIDLAAYLPTIVPPNKKLMPAVDELMQFRQQKDQVEVHPVLDTSHRVLAGVRSCDLRALVLMDKVQADGVRDPHYWARRDHTAIVAVDCAQPCDDRAFCQATRSLGHKPGADVYLTPVAGQIVVECLTPRGEDLLKGAGFEAAKDAAALLKQAADQKPKAFGRQLKVPVDKLPAALKAGYKHPAWEKHVELCFSCGTCTMVCPTCYCFDVKDDLGLDLASGNRVRTWDSCMLPQFSLVAGGHNFRPAAAERQRHRVKRKFEYLMERFGGDSFCVGCGRCGRQCTSHIDIVDIVNDVAGGGA
jgi:formate hydrogenlyase subunit 6/NADH:ubiquinone oxidoreductase subunit I